MGLKPMANSKKPKKHSVKFKNRPVAQLSAHEKARLCRNCGYEGDPEHKRRPGDFGLSPPTATNFDKNLCDDTSVDLASLEEAQDLFRHGIEMGLVSQKTKHDGYPARIWAIRDDGAVFEARYGGSREGRYHGFPLFHGDANYDMVKQAWEARKA